MTSPADQEVGDEGDRARASSDQRERQIVVEHLRQLLAQVKSARERLAGGTYGICMDCGRPIPAERLEALPYATLCVTCQSKRERGNPSGASFALLARH